MEEVLYSFHTCTKDNSCIRRKPMQFNRYTQPKLFKASPEIHQVLLDIYNMTEF